MRPAGARCRLVTALWKGFSLAGICSPLLVVLKVHPKAAQRILRHSQIAMTMEFYAEASEEEVRAALGKLSEAMGGAD